MSRETNYASPPLNANKVLKEDHTRWWLVTDGINIDTAGPDNGEDSDEEAGGNSNGDGNGDGGEVKKVVPASAATGAKPTCILTFDSGLSPEFHFDTPIKFSENGQDRFLRLVLRIIERLRSTPEEFRLLGNQLYVATLIYRNHSWNSLTQFLHAMRLFLSIPAWRLESDDTGEISMTNGDQEKLIKYFSESDSRNSVDFKTTFVHRIAVNKEKPRLDAPLRAFATRLSNEASGCIDILYAEPGSVHAFFDETFSQLNTAEKLKHKQLWDDIKGQLVHFWLRRLCGKYKDLKRALLDLPDGVAFFDLSASAKHHLGLGGTKIGQTTHEKIMKRMESLKKDLIHDWGIQEADLVTREYVTFIEQLRNGEAEDDDDDEDDEDDDESVAANNPVQEEEVVDTDSDQPDEADEGNATESAHDASDGKCDSAGQDELDDEVDDCAPADSSVAYEHDSKEMTDTDEDNNQGSLINQSAANMADSEEQDGTAEARIKGDIKERITVNQRRHSVSNEHDSRRKSESVNVGYTSNQEYTNRAVKDDLNAERGPEDGLGKNESGKRKRGKQGDSDGSVLRKEKRKVKKTARITSGMTQSHLADTTHDYVAEPWSDLHPGLNKR